MHIAAVEAIEGALLPALRRVARGAGRARRRAGRHRHHRPHPSAGRDAADPRSGVFRLDRAARPGGRDDPRRRSTGCYEIPLGGTAVGTGLNAPPASARSRRSASPPRPGWPFRPAGQPVRGRLGARRDGQRQRGAAHAGRRAVQDRQRHPLVRERPARRDRRTDPAGKRARLVDHAGQDQPDPMRGADHGGGAGVRQRPHRRLRRQPGQFPAQRLQADHPAQPAGIGRVAGRGVPLVRRALCRAGSSANESAHRRASATAR